MDKTQATTDRTQILINHLRQDFREPTRWVLERCAGQGIELLPYCGLRTCAEQARLYRASRTGAEIGRKIMSLEDRGFDFLAKILSDVGPQYGALGKHSTYAGPGESFHNYGKAMDAVILVNGKPDWEVNHPKLWQAYGEIIHSASLEWAGTWATFRELVHFQDHMGCNPLKVLSVERIRDLLIEIGTI